MAAHRLVEREGAAEGCARAAHDQVEARIGEHRPGSVKMQRRGHDIPAVGLDVVGEVLEIRGE